MRCASPPPVPAEAVMHCAMGMLGITPLEKI
jgi:hypothetical protein